MIDSDFQARLLDSRDGHVYEMVTIGTRTWMAENLNFETPNSFCYKDNPSNCAKYGRLYTWDAAMVACPVGWHLPSSEEWDELFKFAGDNAYTVGNQLKSTSGWKDGGDGSDLLGFKVLPVGSRNYNGSYWGEGESAHYWTSDEYDSHDINTVNSIGFYYDDDGVITGRGIIPYGHSVRCVKD